MSTEEQLKCILDNIIEKMSQSPNEYVKCPGIYFTRKRKLGMADTMKLILSMQGNSLNKELYKYSQLGGNTLTPSAFVQQRSKILPTAFEALFHAFNNACKDTKTFHGYHIYAVDGSDLNIARDPTSDTYISSENTCGYNQYHVNTLYDLQNKVYADCVLQPRPSSDEHAALITMLRRYSFQGKNLIIADRGYEGYNTIANLIETENVDFLLRVKQGAGGFKDIQRLPMIPFDRDIEITITTTQTNVDKQNGYRFMQTGSKKGKVNSEKTSVTKWDFYSPYTLKLRVVRFELEAGEYETVITSLNREDFSFDLIKELYHMRWGIETSFRELKYDVGIVNQHSKKDDFIQQEIYASLVIYNFCQRIIGTIVLENNKNTYARQVNYTTAIYICRDYYAQLYKPPIDIIPIISRHTLPVRPGRKDKRNIKPQSAVGFGYRVA